MTGMPIIDHLKSTDPPWIQLLVFTPRQDFDLNALHNQFPQFILKVIEGASCKTLNEFFVEFSRVLEFPSYFGRNWDALDECITDLEWMPGCGYILLVQNADQLLSEEAKKQYDIFLAIMKKAGEEWSIPQTGEWARPAIPFHVVLLVSNDKKETRSDWALPTVYDQADI